jgi:hypothetical protein
VRWHSPPASPWSWSGTSDPNGSTIHHQRRFHMLRFIAGAIAGGIAVWMWGDELRDALGERTRGVRARTADQIQLVSRRPKGRSPPPRSRSHPPSRVGRTRSAHPKTIAVSARYRDDRRRAGPPRPRTSSILPGGAWPSALPSRPSRLLCQRPTSADSPTRTLELLSQPSPTRPRR